MPARVNEDRSCPYRAGRARDSAMLECKKAKKPKRTPFTSHDEREFHVRAYFSDVNHEECLIFKELEAAK